MQRRIKRIAVAAAIAALAAVPLLVGGGVAAAQSSSPSASASPSATGTPSAPPTLQLQAGGGQSGIVVEDFLPASVTVKTGTVVTWKNPFGEPHTVTFGTPTSDPTVPENLPSSGPVQYDGTGYFSSGLFAPGFVNGPPGTPATPDTFSVQFTKAGSYNYFCAIHVNMHGSITVVDSGTVDTQDEVNSEIQSQYAAALASLQALQGQQPTSAAVTSNADGTKTYTVTTGAYNSNGDLVQYFPPAVNVTTGDTVKWVSNSLTPHTVTFNADQFQGDPLHSGPAGGPTFDGTGLVNSGIINQPTSFYPPSVFTSQGTSFQLKFTKAGSFQYVCLLHDEEGMEAVINVRQGSAPSPTATSTSGAPKPPSTGSGVASSGSNNLWIGLGILAALFAVSGAGVVAVKRHR